MTDIGRLKPADPDSLARFVGHIQTLDRRIMVRIEGDESLCDARAPSHRIFGRTGAGTEAKVGCAWLKTTKNGSRAGQRFLTLSVDYPGLGPALNVAAFLDPETGDWVIVWRRRGVQQPAELAA